MAALWARTRPLVPDAAFQIEPGDESLPAELQHITLAPLGPARAYPHTLRAAMQRQLAASRFENPSPLVATAMVELSRKDGRFALAFEFGRRANPELYQLIDDVSAACDVTPRLGLRAHVTVVSRDHALLTRPVALAGFVVDVDVLGFWWANERAVAVAF